MNFAGKTIFITGASRGIGQSVAKHFKEYGGFVIGTKTNSSSVNHDYCHEWLQADFSSEKEILECSKFIKSRKDIDILINNAGINKNSNFSSIDLDDFKQIQQVNLLAPFILSQAAVDIMAAKSWGRIVNISSIWGIKSKEGRAAYSASKFALHGMTLAIAAEYNKNGVLANCISPGFIDTSLTRRMLSHEEINKLTSQVPAERLGEVDEIAKLVLWLSSEENSFTTGQNIAIDGGFTGV